MKIAVDIHHLQIEHAGTKRVTVNILEQLQKQNDVELIVLSPSYSLVKDKGVLNKMLLHLLRFFWVHIQLPILCFIKRCDLLLSPEYNTPFLTHCKRAVIAHDAHMRAQQQYTNSLWFYCYYVPFIEYPIRTADVIFTVSNFAKKQIVELMKLDGRKVVVAYNGVDQRFVDHDNSAELRPELKVKLGEQYILFVGTYEARKNIERLIEAFAMIKNRNVNELRQMKLAIVGNPASKMFSDRSRDINRLIERLGLQNDIVLCGYLPDEEVVTVYYHANVIAFPSLHEGFGIPIVEGFASGVPVLTSNICSMPEVAGEAAVLIDPYSIDDIAGHLETLIFDKALRDELIQSGKKRVEVFTWENCINQMMNHLRPLLKHSL